MNAECISVSLIVATLGRTEPLTHLLISLCRQERKDFEVIIVDQNPEGYLSPALLSVENELNLVIVRSARGLARSRNAGLRVARGEVVGFPDDDCWYDAGVLEQCISIFSLLDRPDGITGMCVDERGEQSAGRFDTEGGPLTRQNVWRRANSTTTFCRRTVAATIGGFDESLGLGSGTRWGSGEETDFLIRAMDHGFRFMYVPEFVVRHPQVAAPSAKDSRLRALPYARGFVRVLKKHRYSRATCAAAVIRPAAGSLYFAVTGRWARARLAYWTALGRLQELLDIGCGA
jgi:GT2 family glycosyltransferase